MDSPCLSNMLYIVKQQSYIDLKRTEVETLGDRKHFLRQKNISMAIDEHLYFPWFSMHNESNI